MVWKSFDVNSRPLFASIIYRTRNFDIQWSTSIVLTPMAVVLSSQYRLCYFQYRSFTATMNWFLDFSATDRECPWPLTPVVQKGETGKFFFVFRWVVGFGHLTDNFWLLYRTCSPCTANRNCGALYYTCNVLLDVFPTASSGSEQESLEVVPRD